MLRNIILPTSNFSSFYTHFLYRHVEEILLEVKSYLFDVLYDFIAHRFSR